MARTFKTTVRFKRNRETIIKSATKAVRQDRTRIITTEVNEYHEQVSNAERREHHYG